MTAQQLWDLFTHADGPAVPFEAWAFGGALDELAALVLAGRKTGTSSAGALYRLKNEPFPAVGEYSVILDSKGQAVCVIRTTQVWVMSFNRVPASHAWKEGEGDRSLTHWQAVHRAFFSDALSRAGLLFTEDTEAVCEEFEVVFRP